ncbi:MAG: LytTR family DNA-binding domain-containing protein [Clostridia bacterium]
MIKVLIADDNREMALLLKAAVEAVEGFEVQAIGADGASALGLFIKHKPQVVFLDIEMPELTGMECAKEIIAMDQDVYIIFSTAYEEYMKEAFDLYAYDYMIKPYNVERVKATLSRISNLLGREIEEKRKLEKLLIKNRQEMSFVDFDEIILIYREGNSTVVVSRKSSFNTSENLSSIEEKLDKRHFMRTHKSYIINMNHIEKILPYGRWTHIVKLKNIKEDALITHEKLQKLEEML